MLLSALEGHRLWAPTYDSCPNALLALEERSLPDILRDVAGLQILDVACGTGRWMTRLAAQGARVTGIDLCREMLLRAASKPGLTGRLALADAAVLPMASESADLVLCCLAIGYVAELGRTFAEIARAARRGGRVVVAELHPARVAAGSTRSFEANGSSYSMHHFGRSTGELLTAAQSTGLQLESRRDVCFGEPEEHFFRQAGMMEVFRGQAQVPAIWNASWKKP